MARVFIDCHMFSESWFSPILEDMVKSPNVIFVFGLSSKHISERSKVRKAVEFFKLIGNRKSANGESRRIDVSTTDLKKHEDFLCKQPSFSNCGDCDDPHIFALIYLKPTPFIFSKDARIAKCRSVINKDVDNRYCQFIIIIDPHLYKTHRQRILAT